MNDQTNHIKMKAVTMLIVKSESIQKYMLLRRSKLIIKPFFKFITDLATIPIISHFLLHN